MNEDEYINYYCQHLLVHVPIDGKTAYCDNDIRTLNYDAVLHNAEEFNITRKSFVSAVGKDSYKNIKIKSSFT